MVAIKFAESVVLACVGGRGVGAGSWREGDKSVQRELSPSHPFLSADTLDQAGHALARQMVSWLGTTGSSGGASASGWGTDFGTQHYTVLINALQSLATNRAALFADIVPALATALEAVTNGEKGAASAKRGASSGGGAAGEATEAPGSSGVAKGLLGASTSLRSACLKLLKVAPEASKSVQRLAEAAAVSGSDGEASAAVEGNPAIRGRVRVPGAVPRSSRGRGGGGQSGMLANQVCWPIRCDVWPTLRRAHANPTRPSRSSHFKLGFASWSAGIWDRG